MTAAHSVKPGTVFPNPPLREATVEVRFNPLLRIDRDIASFQEKITNSHPVLSTQPAPIDETVVNTFLFSAEDRSSTIRASDRSFAYSTQRYSGFADFKSAALDALGTFVDIYSIPLYRRLALRYISSIKLARRGDSFNFDEYVVPAISTDRYPANEVQQQTVFLVLRKKSGSLAIRSGIMTPHAAAGSPEAAYLLDLAFSSNDSVAGDAVQALMDEFHEEIEREFLAHLTEKMIERMMQPGSDK